MVWPELIGPAIEGIESAPFLTDEQKHDIFYNNAARFLGLPTLPAPNHTQRQPPIEFWRPLKSAGSRGLTKPVKLAATGAW